METLALVFESGFLFCDSDFPLSILLPIGLVVVPGIPTHYYKNSPTNTKKRMEMSSQKALYSFIASLLLGFRLNLNSIT